MFYKWPLKSICLFLLLFSTSLVYSATNPHWETIFYSDTSFHYTTSNQGAPDANWRELDFDASAWKTGKGGVGYGDNDDNTNIEVTNALFLRRTFSIQNKEEILQAVLSIDYDDSFVAYLNGHEIARSTGLSQGYPAFDEISSLNHEAKMFQNGVPENFTISAQLLSQYLLAGDNVLAVEVHNSDVNSSDMSSIMFLMVELESEENRYFPIPEWFVAPLNFTSSNLPIFVINTEGKSILDEPKTNVHMGVIYNDSGARNHITDTFNHYNGTIGIELRGNSTQGFPKKPYSVETRLEGGENNDVALLGFPEENDWVLRASYYDHTFIRNPLAHHMSRLMGNWSSGNKHFELVLNGEYQGIYILVEKIKRTKNRLNLSKLKPDDILGEELSGGYIYEVAGQHDDFGLNRRLRYPDLEDATPEQLAYIRNYDDDFRAAMSMLSADKPLSDYEEWIDVQTFVDYMLIQEASRNPDGYGWSCYFHKDKNGKLRAGPVWDFDQSMYNSQYRDGEKWTGWCIDYRFTPDPPFYMEMIHEPYFSYRIKTRWETLRQNEFSDENLFHYVDSIAEHLSEATERNFQKWPNLGKLIWRELPGYEFLDTYEKQVTSLKQYLQKRWAWMDQELAKVAVYTTIEDRYTGSKMILFPNPASNSINIDLSLSKEELVGIKIFNSLGQLVHQKEASYQWAGNNRIYLNLPSHIKQGVYILQVSIGDKTYLTERFVKKNR